jgi:hypothetical protein
MTNGSLAFYSCRNKRSDSTGDGYIIGYNVHFFPKGAVGHAVLVLGLVFAGLLLSIL